METRPPAIHAKKNQNGDGSAAATPEGVKKMALATTPPTINKTASVDDNPRTKAGGVECPAAGVVVSEVVWGPMRASYPTTTL